MSPLRPDIVECWVFRDAPGGEVEYLLIHRAPGRIYPGLWQCVTGRLDAGEPAPVAALREVQEETGLGPGEIEGFFDLDQAVAFYAEEVDGIVSSVIFAVRVRADAAPRISEEHDDLRWVDREEALRLTVWPAYRDSIERIEQIVADDEHARWFALAPDGRRLAR
jgi:8-oxo-dGTP pyrophosphatase MutT (NUDIX family)